MTNSERTTSTADIPKGSTPLPAPVLEAYKNLIDVCSANKVPLRTLFSVDHIEKLHEATLKIEELEKIVKQRGKLIALYEKDLGLDEL
ncbi:hypothetical protein [Frankia tisae]|uniref:hypothetical protein n=1 Tax=Frankia tisae TaxID=2950104 RepID=UPI0021BEEE63|nr:hypothetical protein [Frankia tisae]